MGFRTTIYHSVIFPLMDYVFGRDTFAAYAELRRLELAPKDELHIYQLKKLRELFEYSFRHVPYYRELCIREGLDTEDLKTLEDLRKFPILTKAQIQMYRQHLLSDEQHGRLKEFPTSASTGTPLVVLEDQKTNSWRRAIKWRYLSWWGIDIGERGAVIWLQPIKGAKGPLMKRLGFILNNCNTFLDVSDLSEKKMRRFWNQMVARRISYLYGYTSAITTLARFALKEGLHESAAVALKVVIPTTETLFPRQREDMELAFRCKVANEYGCAELGDIAFECPAGNMHIAAETYLVEMIPPYFEKESGFAGQVVVTHLRKKSMPIIRYALGDVVHLVNRDCPCGRKLPVIKSVEGRISDIITTPKGKVIHSEVFDYIMREFSTLKNPAVVAFRAIQNKPSEFELLVIPGPAYSARTREGISRFFKKVFGDECFIRVKEVDRIPPNPSGKMRFFLSRVPKQVHPSTQ